MDFEEFAAVYNSYAEQRDADFKAEWERIRMLAFITIQPQLDHKKAGRMTPDKLLPFPWDNKPTHNADAPKLTAEQQRERMKKLADKLGDETI